MYKLKSAAPHDGAMLLGSMLEAREGARYIHCIADAPAGADVKINGLQRGYEPAFMSEIFRF